LRAKVMIGEEYPADYFRTFFTVPGKEFP